MSYVYREDKDPEIVDSACFDPSHKQAQREIMDAMCMRREIKKPLMHAIISVDAHERMEDDQWQEVVRTYMDKMGFDMCPYVAVRHHDTDHDHIHIIASRVSDVDRSLVSDSFDYYRAQSVLREIEKQHDLKRVPSSWEKGKDYVKPMSQARLHKDKREGKTEVYKTLITRVQEVQSRAKDMPDFKRKLAAHGIDLVPKVARHRAHIQGVYFEHEGVKVAGSKLNRAYSWGNLQKQLPYDAERDFEVMTRPPTPEQMSASATPVEATGLPAMASKTPKIAQARALAMPVKKAPGEVDKQRMKKALARAKYDKGWAGFVTSMRAQGVDVVPKVAQSDQQKMTGLYLEFGGVLYPASKVDRQASFGNIQKRVGAFDVHKYEGEFKRVMVPGVGVLEPSWRPVRPPAQRAPEQSMPVERTPSPSPGKTPTRAPDLPQLVPSVERTPERLSSVPKYVDSATQPPVTTHPNRLVLSEGVLDANRLHKACLEHGVKLSQSADAKSTEPVRVMPARVRLGQKDMRVLMSKDKGYVLVGESAALAKMQGKTIRLGDAVGAYEYQLRATKQVKFTSAPVRLERDMDVPISQNKTLASMQQKVLVAQDKNRQLLSVEQLVRVQQKQGHDWRTANTMRAGKHTVMEHAVQTKDGMMTALVDRHHSVTLVPYDRQHDVHRGKDVLLARGVDRQPVLRDIDKAQTLRDKAFVTTPVVLEREHNKPLLKDSVLARLKEPRVFKIHDEGRQLIGVNKLIEQQQNKGQVWQYAQDASPGKRTVMEGVIQTKEGPMTVLVNRYHSVALVPHQVQHDKFVGQDVELTHDVNKQPALRPLQPERTQPAREHIPAQTHKHTRSIDHTKPERECVNELPKGSVLARLKEPRVFEMRDDQKQLMSTQALIDMQGKQGKVWQQAKDASDGKRTVMEGIIKTKEGPMTVLVNRYHSVALVPHDKRYDAFVGKDVQLDKTRGLRTLDGKDIAPKQTQERPKQALKLSVDDYIQRYESGGHTTRMLGAGKSVRGKVLDQLIDAKEGQFRIIQSANKRLVLVPNSPELDRLVNQRTQVSRTRDNEIKVGISQDKTRSRDDR